ncbi:DUF1294 domain-containing protein [Roseomonas fluvialis]|uniref:DUF1294 domain-containing protein n=1 Tax=Roseomonas fluvialis TaxID=1750527 RepID=A0ABM7XZZ0_9PROT|nr:DUF1294 domain-containing protein [Roseomonas fluvialis]BDG71091.1 hypothetical protein Rmf_10200 [Roseomonas fluvialis]
MAAPACGGDGEGGGVARLHAADILLRVLGICCWLVAMNILAIVAVHHDKRMAQQRRWRLSERLLLLIALLGGSPGMLVARRRFRHKTRKQPFTAALYAVCGLQVVAIAWLVLNGPTIPPAVLRQVSALTSR